MSKKISELTAVTDVTPSDLFQVIDVEDSAMASSGTNKKVTAQTLGNYLPVRALGTTTTRTLSERFSDTVNVKDFGAAGDGIQDDTAAIQAALNSQLNVYMPAGTYITTSELVWKNGSRLTGAGNWSAVSSPTYDDGSVTRIKYNGAGGTNSCVCRVSTLAVGIYGASTTQIENVSCTNITIDGGGIAEFGLYIFRGLSNNQFDYVTCTNTLKHGFYVATSWNGTVVNWMAYKNLGCGITIGINIFGWSGSGVSATVDQSTFISPFGYFCGYNFSTVKQNQFNETTNSDKEYGIGVGGGRGLSFINTQAAKCGGAGLYISNKFNPVKFLGGYIEATGESTGNVSGKSWVIWVQGADGGVSWNLGFDGFHFGLVPNAIRLTGDAPSRAECGVEFKNVGTITEISADWDNYRLINCDRNTTFTGTAPASPQLAPTGLLFDINQNTFNHYDEGVFTPAIAGITTPGTGWQTSLAVGAYTRIGRVVFFTGRITLSVVSTDATGQIAITGLPFTVKNGNNFSGAVTLSQIANLATSVVSVDGSLTIDNTRFTLQKRTAAATSGSAVVLADLSSTTTLIFSGHYVAE